MKTSVAKLVLLLALTVFNFAQAPQDPSFTIEGEKTMKEFLIFFHETCDIDFVADVDVPPTVKVFMMRTKNVSCRDGAAAILRANGLSIVEDPGGIMRIAITAKLEVERQRREYEQGLLKIRLEAEQKRLAPKPELQPPARVTPTTLTSAPPATTPPAPRPVELRDDLKLRSTSIATEGQTPIVCGMVVESSKLQAAHSYYFGGGGSRNLKPSAVGNIIQGKLCDVLAANGYASVPPETGFMATVTDTIRREGNSNPARNLARGTQVSQNQPQDRFRKAQFVVIGDVTFEKLAFERRIVDPTRLGNIIGRAVGGDTGRGIRDGSREFRMEKKIAMVSAWLNVRFYDAITGVQVKVVTVPGRMDWIVEEKKHISLYKLRAMEDTTIAPLGLELVAEFAAKLR